MPTPQKPRKSAKDASLSRQMPDRGKVRRSTMSFATSQDFLARLNARSESFRSKSQAIESDLTTYWTLIEIGLSAAQRALSAEDAEEVAMAMDAPLDAAQLYYLAGGGLPSMIRAKVQGREGEDLSLKIEKLDRLAVIGLADWASRASNTTPDGSDFYG